MAIVDYFVGAGGTAAVVGALSPVASRLIKHIVREVVDAAVKEVRDKVETLAVQFAREHGGNSGGIRQEVNAIRADVAGVREAVAKVQGQLTPVATAVVAGAAAANKP